MKNKEIKSKDFETKSTFGRLFQRWQIFWRLKKDIFFFSFLKIAKFAFHKLHQQEVCNESNIQISLIICSADHIWLKLILTVMVFESMNDKIKICQKRNSSTLHGTA